MTIRESDLRIVWSRGLFRQDGLRTEDSRPILIEFPGIPARLGPDFRVARFLLAGDRRAGDVELHLFTSGWAAHRHRDNLEYANVQLHVALWRDPRPKAAVGCDGESIPELVLEPYLQRPLAELISAVNDRYPDPAELPADLQSLARLLDAAGDEWLSRKARRFERLLKLLPAEEVAYREFLAAMGYSANKAQFEQLASLVPFASVRGRGEIEIRQMLEARAGFRDDPSGGPRLDPALWRRRGVRPTNYPERRVTAAACVLARIPEGLAAAFERDLLGGDPVETGARRLARRLMEASGGAIGADRARDVVINVAAPLLLAQARIDGRYEAAQDLKEIYSRTPAPEDTQATRAMKEQLFGRSSRAEIVTSLRRYLGLLHWYRGFQGGPMSGA